MTIKDSKIFELGKQIEVIEGELSKTISDLEEMTKLKILKEKENEEKDAKIKELEMQVIKDETLRRNLHNIIQVSSIFSIFLI